MSANKPPFDGEWVRLKGRVEYVRGVTYKAAVDLHEELDRGSYILLRANNIQDGRLSFDDVQYVDKSKVKPKQLLRKGDILICASSGSRSLVGKAALVENDVPITFGAFCCVLRPKTGESEYLGHYFQSRQYRKAIERACSGSNINNLKAASFESLIVPLYSKTDMLSVVGVLDALVAQKRGTESQLELLDTLVKSRFVEMFGGMKYESVPMGHLVAEIVAGTNVGGKQRSLLKGEYGVLKISAVTRGVFDASQYKVVEDVSSIKMVHPRKGDLLFSRANTSEMVGATAIVDKDCACLFLPDKLWRIDPTDEVNTVFLKALLSSSRMRREISNASTGSSGSMQNISMTKFRSLPAFLPPLALQQEFASFVAEVDKSRFIVQRKVEKLQTLYDSLAQEYFG